MHNDGGEEAEATGDCGDRAGDIEDGGDEELGGEAAGGEMYGGAVWGDGRTG